MVVHQQWIRLIYQIHPRKIETLLIRNSTWGKDCIFVVYRRTIIALAKWHQNVSMSRNIVVECLQQLLDCVGWNNLVGGYIRWSLNVIGQLKRIPNAHSPSETIIQDVGCLHGCYQQYNKGKTKTEPFWIGRGRKNDCKSTTDCETNEITPPVAEAAAEPNNGFNCTNSFRI